MHDSKVIAQNIHFFAISNWLGKDEYLVWGKL